MLFRSAALTIAVFFQFKVPHLKNVSTEGQEVDENQHENQDESQDENQDENQDIESDDDDDDEAQIKSILFILLLQKIRLDESRKNLI